MSRRSETVAKWTTRVIVRADLLEAARTEGINLSVALEWKNLLNGRARSGARTIVVPIAAYNRYVGEHGTFSDGLRSF
jgi:post-segregation antitoxin (ccd killing protein)